MRWRGRWCWRRCCEGLEGAWKGVLLACECFWLRTEVYDPCRTGDSCVKFKTMITNPFCGIYLMGVYKWKMRILPVGKQHRLPSRHII